jgi:hypothetical protein
LIGASYPRFSPWALSYIAIFSYQPKLDGGVTRRRKLAPHWCREINRRQQPILLLKSLLLAETQNTQWMRRKDRSEALEPQDWTAQCCRCCVSREKIKAVTSTRRMRHRIWTSPGDSRRCLLIVFFFVCANVDLVVEDKVRGSLSDSRNSIERKRKN